MAEKVDNILKKLNVNLARKGEGNDDGAKGPGDSNSDRVSVNDLLGGLHQKLAEGSSSGANLKKQLGDFVHEKVPRSLYPILTVPRCRCTSR